MIYSIDRVHQRFEEQNLEPPSFSRGSLTWVSGAPFSDVKEVSGRIPHIFCVLAQFSVENLDIISSNPVTCSSGHEYIQRRHLEEFSVKVNSDPVEEVFASSLGGMAAGVQWSLPQQLRCFSDSVHLDVGSQGR